MHVRLVLDPPVHLTCTLCIIYIHLIQKVLVFSAISLVLLENEGIIAGIELGVPMTHDRCSVGYCQEHSSAP